MANGSVREGNLFYRTIKHFPPVIGDELNTEEFLAASSDLILLVDRLGKSFLPVKYDMQGNVDKIRKQYEANGDTSLFHLMDSEIQKGVPLVAAEAVLWLNRALLFFEIVFDEIIKVLQTKQLDVSMKKIFTIAYEGSVKKYHNWVSQQLFSFMCKMSPTIPQLLKSFECEDGIQDFEDFLVAFHQHQHPVRSAIDKFFKDRNIFIEP